MVFDEVEDVFNDGGGLFGVKSTAQRCKAWINRMLEDNPVPTLWLSNSIGCLDPAFIRRFDMVIELPVPPRAQRERIIRDACTDLRRRQHREASRRVGGPGAGRRRPGRVGHALDCDRDRERAAWRQASRC